MKQILLLAFIFFLSSCGQAPEKRRYEEIVIKGESPHPFLDMMNENPHASMPQVPEKSTVNLGSNIPEVAFSWKTPDGWQEKAGSGMRIATFLIQDGSNKAECSIVSLGAEAGTLEANVVRWANQIKMPLEKNTLEEFLSTQETIKTQDQHSVKIIDFTSLQEKQQGNSPSMIAAVLNYPTETVFIKLIGPKGIVKANREKFKNFCRIFKPKDS